jgi:tetratricopeptide (TPR) repeat protein
VAALLRWPAAVHAEEEEPSIEEMLAGIESRLGAESAAKGGATTHAPAEGETVREPGADEGGRELPNGSKQKPAVARARRTLGFGQLRKRLNARARESADYYRRGDHHREMVGVLMRSEAFDKAATVLGRLLRRSGEHWGWPEGEYACVMTYLGRDVVVAQYVEASKKRLEEASGEGRGADKDEAKWLRGRHAHALGYPDAREKLRELTSSLTVEPDADRQWELVKLCDPEHGEAKLAVRWLEAIHEMRVLYPDDERNHDGTTDRELSRAYRHHEMFEECIAHVAEVLEEEPKTIEYVANGSAAWDHAYAHEMLGRHMRHMLDRRATATYQKAIKLYEAMKEDYPDSWYNKRDPSAVDKGIQRAKRGIGRVRR